jgi:hypothetical protein
MRIGEGGDAGWWKEKGGGRRRGKEKGGPAGEVDPIKPDYKNGGGSREWCAVRGTESPRRGGRGGDGQMGEMMMG